MAYSNFYQSFASTIVISVSLWAASIPLVWAQELSDRLLLQASGHLEAGDETLDDGSFFDPYVFEGQAGQRIEIRLESTVFDPYLLLFNAEFEKLAENDDVTADNRQSMIAITLPEDGEYFIAVNSYGEGETGPYSLTVTAIGSNSAGLNGHTPSTLGGLESSKSEADRLLQQGIQQAQISQFREALQSWHQALDIYREIGDQAGEGAALTNLSIVYNKLGQYQEAITRSEQSLEIYRELSYRTGEGIALNNLGDAYRHLGQYRQAIYFHEQSLMIAHEIGNRVGEGDALTNLGNVYLSLSQYREAIDLYEQHLAISREIGNRFGEATSLNNLGEAYRRLAQHQQAIVFYEQSLVITREIGDRAMEGTILGNLGSSYLSLSQYQEAIVLCEQQLAIAHEIGDRAGEGNALRTLGIAYVELGQYQEAIVRSEQSLEIYREIGDRAGEGGVLNNLGEVYRRLGQYQQAIDFYEQSLVITREIGDRAGEGNTLVNMGATYYRLGQYQQAIIFYEQSLVIIREIGDRAGERGVLNNLGEVYHGLGQYQQAIDFYEQSLAITHEIGDRAGEGRFLGNLGLVRLDLGQYREAIALHEQSLTIAQELGDRAAEGILLGNLGNAYFKLSQYQQAIDFYEHSLVITREIGDYAVEGRSLGNLGVAYSNLGQYQQAIDFYEQSLVIAREIGDRAGEGQSLGSLGNAYYRLGQYQQAIDLLKQQLTIAREIGDRAGESLNLNNLGFVLFETEQFPPAEYQLSEAIKILDELRDTALKPAERISLFETQLGTYRILQQALVAQNKVEQALEISEQGRARVLAEQISSNNLNSAIDSVPDLEQIRRIAQQQNATLVSYSITTPVPALFIWVVSPSGPIDFKQVPLSTTDAIDFSTITTLIEPDSPFYRSPPTTSADTLIVDTRSALGIGRGIDIEWDEDEPPSDHLQQLHQLLIDPIQEYLPTDPDEKVIFIPQGGLFMVPFPALHDANGTRLIEKHTILTAPSIQVLGLTYQLKNDRSLTAGNPLVIGNPIMPTVWNPETGNEEQLAPLVGAEQEALAIANLFNTQALIGSQATEATIKQRITQASLIHLATHGLLEYGTPQDSGVLDVPGAIALAPGNSEDGLLTSAELSAMDLNADLVVLSACDTGRGRVTGDGVIGLSRSLITAGVPSIMVSLWSVPDAPTASLMTEFYQNMQQGMDKAQALRQAMLTTMQTHPHPRDWAAFTLIGESN